MVIVALCFWDAQLCYPSTEWSKYSNCTVNPSKYDKENQGIHFRYHRKAHLIHYFGREQTPLLTHVIQCRIQVRPWYFINRVRPAWPGQNMTRSTGITQMTRPGFNPGLDILRPNLLIRVAGKQVSQKNYHDTHGRVQQFAVSQKVLVENMLTKSTDVRWLPGTVLEKLGAVMYTKLLYIVHLHAFKIWEPVMM